MLPGFKNQSGGAVAFSGGELKWDDNHQGNDQMKGMIQTAAWDAHTLATFSNTMPGWHNARDIALWKTWMGPDYTTQQQRVVGKRNTTCWPLLVSQHADSTVRQLQTGFELFR